MTAIARVLAAARDNGWEWSDHSTRRTEVTRGGVRVEVHSERPGRASSAWVGPVGQPFERLISPPDVAGQVIAILTTPQTQEAPKPGDRADEFAVQEDGGMTT